MNNNQTLPQPAPRRYWPFAIPEPTILPDAMPSKKKAYLWLCFLIPAALMYLIYVILDVSFVIYLCRSGNGDGSLAEIWQAMVNAYTTRPLGSGQVLVLDLNGQYVYFYEALRNFIYGDASLLYSFSRALGGEFMGIYDYYLSSPFSYLVALFPKGRIIEAILCIFLLKTGLCGLTFGYYLHKTAKDLTPSATVLFSVLYALSAYAVVQQHNSMWIDAVIFLPILSFAIEELIKKGHYRLFTLTLALVLMCNYYIGYMVCIYTALYFFYYYFSRSEDGRNNPYGERCHFIRSLTRIALFSAIAIGIAAFIIFTAYYSLSFGKTTFSDPKWDFLAKFDILELLAKFLPGSYDTVRPEGLPFVYCGVLTLILVPLYFMSSRVRSSEKIGSGILIGVFVASFMLNPIDLIWHGFQNPNWLNYRYSFMLCFLLLTLAAKGFESLRDFSGKTFLAIASLICLLAVILQRETLDTFVLSSEYYTAQKMDTFGSIWFTIILALIYVAALHTYKKASPQKAAALMLAGIVCVEAFGNGLLNTVALGEDVVHSSHASYNDFINSLYPAANAIKEQDPSFYRIEKTHHRKVNDNMTLGLRGLSNSTSTLNAKTVDFLRVMGYASKSHWSKYLGGTPVNDSLLGIKYVISQTPTDLRALTEAYHTEKMMNRLYESVYDDGDFVIYQNPYALSLAYAVDKKVDELVFVDEKDFDVYPNPFEQLNAIVGAMLGMDEPFAVFEPLTMLDTYLTNCTVSSIAKHDYYLPKSTSTDASIWVEAEPVSAGEVFFYLPSDYWRTVKISINGREYDSFYGNETDRIMNLGYYEADEFVEIRITLDSDNLYVKQDVSFFYSINYDNLNKAIEALSASQLILDDRSTDDHLFGTISLPEDGQTVLTTIPYDAGWRVTVDGKPVKTYETMDALMAFTVDKAGEHTVDLCYRSDAILLGGMCSVTTLALFLLFILIDRKARLIEIEPPAPFHTEN